MNRISSLRAGGFAAAFQPILPPVLCALALSATVTPAVTLAASAPMGWAAAPEQATALGSATLAECVAAGYEGERSATFAAEMSAIPGSVRMEIRIELQERAAGQPLFRAVLAPGLGVWRASEVGVHVYRYLRQVTNLSPSGVYRASVHFRWLSAHGEVLRRAERLTPRCSPPPAVEAEPGSAARMK